MRAKIRRAELDAGAPPRPRRHGGQPVSASAKEREAERELVQRAEVADPRLVDDWRSEAAQKRRRDKGARIFWALCGASSAAGISPRACALARSSPAPSETVAKEGANRSRDLTFIRNS